MKIYPKASKTPYGADFDAVIKESKGVEIQFFDEKGITSPFEFEEFVREIKNKYPQLEEIIVHPPLNDYALELILAKDEKIFINQLEIMTKLSRELNIEMDFVYHIFWSAKQYVSTGFADKIKKLLKSIEGEKVTVLIENLYMLHEEGNECAAVELCKYIDHPNLRCCFDITHLHCKANIYRKNIIDLIDTEMKKEDCEKYVKQVHFAATLNNDGFISKKTHGRGHQSIETLKEDFEILKILGIEDKNIITEVGEDDYFTRVDQRREIEMLKEITTK